MNKQILKFLYSCLIVFTSFTAQADNTGVGCQFIDGAVPIKNSVIKYFQVGAGQPVLLLHGLFAQKEQWLDFACNVSRHGYAVYAPDLPGYGQSTGFPIESYKLSEEVRSIHQFVQSLGLQTFHVAGNSMGGAIMAKYNTQYPDNVQSMAFIGAPLGVIGWSPQVRSAIFKGVNPFIPINLNQFDLEMSLLFFKPPTISSEIKESAINEYVSNNLHYQQVWNIVNLDLMMLEENQVSTTPTFIAWGLHDGVYNIAGKQLLDKIFPHGVSLTIANAAHLVMLEQAIEVSDEYLTFLKTVKP
jgi:abhydrolase domain-containing protein 6